LTKQSKNWGKFNATIFTNKNINDIVSSIQKKYGGVIPVLALISIITNVLGAAGGVAGGVASAISASNNARAAATTQAELQRHNREVEAQLKAGSGVIADYVGKTPMIGNLLKSLLQKLGFGVGVYNRSIKGGCVYSLWQRILFETIWLRTLYRP